jgi:hypothetical protein
MTSIQNSCLLRVEMYGWALSGVSFLHDTVRRIKVMKVGVHVLDIPLLSELLAEN